MFRIILIYIFQFTLVSTVLISCKQSPEKPNILYIMSDDHAVKAISAYHKGLIETPNIDKIAKEGILFTNSYVTNSICAPSRATMLTGKYSSQNKLRDNRDRFDGEQQTWIKLVKENGYETFMMGKWHLKTEPKGFDNWRILMGQGHYYNPQIWENGDTSIYTGYTTDLITEFAIDALDKRDKSKPFAMLVHHKAPHRNWMPNAKFFDAFKNKTFPLPDTFYDKFETRVAAKDSDMKINDLFLSADLKLHKDSYEVETGTGGNAIWAKNAEKNWAANYNRMTKEQKAEWDEHYDKINEEFKKANLNGKDLLNWKYQRYLEDYLGTILSVDESVGKLLDYLKENGLEENTIVVYTSDQGFYLGEHGWYDKRWMYEESFATPFLVKYPAKIKAGQINKDFIMNIDYAPTFLDYAGVDIPDDIQGESMRPIWEGNTPSDWRKSMYYHYYEYPHGWHLVHKHYGVRQGPHKLIYYYGIDEWELFNLDKDPNEINNIYESENNSELVKSLKKELQRLRAKYKEN